MSQNGNGTTPRTRVPKTAVTEAMREKAIEKADEIMRPYLKTLEMRESTRMSPQAKLAFFRDQMQAAEKLLNRAEGTPVQRTRRVDADDNDVLPNFDQLPGPALMQLLERALAGAPVVVGEIVESTAEEA